MIDSTLRDLGMLVAHWPSFRINLEDRGIVVHQPIICLIISADLKMVSHPMLYWIGVYLSSTKIVIRDKGGHICSRMQDTRAAAEALTSHLGSTTLHNCGGLKTEVACQPTTDRMP